MNARRLAWVLLPLFFLGCEDDTTTAPPPAPLTPDEQVVANCRALRNSIEEYAAAHGGSYGEGWLHGITFFANPYTGEDEPSILLPGPGRILVNSYTGCTGDALGYRITGYGKDGVLIVLESLTRVPQEVRYATDVTTANALLVFDAAKRYAAANNGKFPEDVNGTPNLEGQTLVDLLPNGEYLVNPISSMQDTPADGSAMEGGAIGYTPIDMVGDGTVNAFMVDAMACNGSQILVLLPYSAKEEFILQDGLYLRVAVEAFKAASGHYPRDLDTETTPGGKTVLDLYFVGGRDFKNPFTNEEYVPAIGIATNRGEVAYQPIESAGVVTDFLITARGVVEEIQRIGPLE